MGNILSYRKTIKPKDKSKIKRKIESGTSYRIYTDENGTQHLQTYKYRKITNVRSGQENK